MQVRIPAEGLIPVSQGGCNTPEQVCQSLPAPWILPRDGFATGDFVRIFSIQASLLWRPWFHPCVCLTCRENKAGMSSGGWMSPAPFLGQGMCWWDAPGSAELGTGGPGTSALC